MGLVQPPIDFKGLYDAIFSTDVYVLVLVIHINNDKPNSFVVISGRMKKYLEEFKKK